MKYYSWHVAVALIYLCILRCATLLPVTLHLPACSTALPKINSIKVCPGGHSAEITTFYMSQFDRFHFGLEMNSQTRKEYLFKSVHINICWAVRQSISMKFNCYKQLWRLKVLESHPLWSLRHFPDILEKTSSQFEFPQGPRDPRTSLVKF